MVVHEGYFPIGAGKCSRQEGFRLVNHLHDVLVRILLKMIGYQGTYVPTVARVAAQKVVDWVTPNTTAADLGYV